MAVECERLLACPPETQDMVWHGGSYRRRLARMGLMKGPKTVDQEELAFRFERFYGRRALRLLHCEVRPGEESCWLKAISRKHRRSFHPLRHVLLSLFLAAQDETEPDDPRPFGTGPWPCLNQAAEHCRQNVITTVMLSRCERTGVPIGTFACSCGFVYTRRGPERSAEERFTYSVVKAFGSVWEERLGELLDHGLSLRAVAQELGCDPGTVKKHAAQSTPDVSLTENHPANQPATDGSKGFPEQRAERRRRWLELRERHPALSKTDLRAMDQAVYAWLYRHDRDWLLRNSPEKQDVRRPHERVDWAHRDEKLMHSVAAVVEEMLSSEQPQRITRCGVARQLGKLSLFEKHLDKLPRTRAFLERHTESVEQYRIRRVGWAARMLHERGREVKVWNVMRLAGLRFDCGRTVLQAIEDVVRSYGIGGKRA